MSCNHPKTAFEEQFYGSCAECSHLTGESIMAFELTRASVVTNQKRRWEQHKHAKDILQPYTVENGQRVVNKDFVKVYGAKAVQRFEGARTSGAIAEAAQKQRIKPIKL